MTDSAASVSKQAPNAVRLRPLMRSLPYFAVQCLHRLPPCRTVRTMTDADKGVAIVTPDRDRRTERGRRANLRSGSRPAPQSSRVSITLTGETLTNALALAEQHHITPGDVARRGIAVLKLLTDEQEKGSILRIQSPTGETDRIRIVFT
jgi:hypothetical protein